MSSLSVWNPAEAVFVAANRKASRILLLSLFAVALCAIAPHALAQQTIFADGSLQAEPWAAPADAAGELAGLALHPQFPEQPSLSYLET